MGSADLHEASGLSAAVTDLLTEGLPGVIPEAGDPGAAAGVFLRVADREAALPPSETAKVTELSVPFLGDEELVDVGLDGAAVQVSAAATDVLAVAY